MKKSNLFFLCLLVFCVSMLSGCSDNEKVKPDGTTDDIQDNPAFADVISLINKAGRIETLPVKNVQTLISEEKSEKEEYYQDTETGLDYMGHTVKQTTHHSVVDNPNEFVLLEPWDVLWPGALIQGKSLTGGVPASVPIIAKRRPGRIYLLDVSGNTDEVYKTVPVMSGAYVTQAMNDILSKHLNANKADLSYEIESVGSTEELALKLGINLKLWGAKLTQNFGSNWDMRKSYVAVKLYQKFFTMCYDNEGGIGGMFTDDITANDLKNYTGPGNPICYVNSVTYGCYFIMLYESSVSRNKLELAVRAAYGGQAAGVSSVSKETFSESKCKLVQIGGDPVAGLETTFGNFDKLKDFLWKGTVVSATNIGAPISYKISHLVDNSPVCLSNTLEYDVTTQMFVASKPTNTVMIDFFNAVMRSPQPERKRNISNYSSFTLKEIYVHLKNKETGEITKTKYLMTKGPVTRGIAANGAIVPIYDYIELPDVSAGSRIRIECEFYVKNQTYGGTTRKDEDTFKLVQDFDYNKDKNAWEPIEKNPNAFTEISKHLDSFGGATMDFKLNYQFKCDGMIYPLLK